MNAAVYAASLPNHPLVVHIPVALLPLAAIGVVAMAIHRPWVQRFGPVVAGLAGVGFVGAYVASSTGEELEEELEGAGETVSSTLENHTELGDVMPYIAGLFFVVVLAWVLFAWWRRRVGEEKAVATVRKPGLIANVLMVLSVLVAVWSTVAIIQTGHSGAKSVWEEGAPAASAIVE